MRVTILARLKSGPEGRLYVDTIVKIPLKHVILALPEHLDKIITMRATRTNYCYSSFCRGTCRVFAARLPPKIGKKNVITPEREIRIFENSVDSNDIFNRLSIPRFRRPVVTLAVNVYYIIVTMIVQTSVAFVPAAKY